MVGVSNVRCELYLIIRCWCPVWQPTFDSQFLMDNFGYLIVRMGVIALKLCTTCAGYMLTEVYFPRHFLQMSLVLFGSFKICFLWVFLLSTRSWMAIVNPVVSGKISPAFSHAFDAIWSTFAVSRSHACLPCRVFLPHHYSSLRVSDFIWLRCSKVWVKRGVTNICVTCNSM
jgi:hypothetical protein